MPTWGCVSHTRCGPRSQCAQFAVLSVEVPASKAMACQRRSRRFRLQKRLSRTLVWRRDAFADAVAVEIEAKLTGRTDTVLGTAPGSKAAQEIGLVHLSAGIAAKAACGFFETERVRGARAAPARHIDTTTRNRSDSTCRRLDALAISVVSAGHGQIYLSLVGRNGDSGGQAMA